MNRSLFTLILFLSPVFGFARDKNYPIEIIGLRLQDKYDEAKWRLYCIHSDDTLKYWDTNKPKGITFGELPMKFDNLEMLNDSVIINFVFRDDSSELDRYVVGNFIVWGVVFNGNNNQVVCYTTAGGLKYYMHKCTKVPDEKCNLREVKPLQPEVINYIQNNKAKIDPWFRREAIKRGVINE